VSGLKPGSSRSKLPLKTELYLPGIQRFDETTVCIQAVVGADENRIRVVD